MPFPNLTFKSSCMYYQNIDLPNQIFNFIREVKNIDSMHEIITINIVLFDKDVIKYMISRAKETRCNCTLMCKKYNVGIYFFIDVGITDEKGPNMKAIIGGVGGGILCSILFVTFACCCLSPNRSPCRRGPQQRTVSPADRPQASRHRPVRRDGHRRNPSSVSTISTSMFTPHLNRGVPSMAHPEEIPLELRPPPYTSAPPPPLEIEVIPSSASNSSSSPPPPYAEHDPHPNCVRSDSVPSYHSR